MTSYVDLRVSVHPASSATGGARRLDKLERHCSLLQTPGRSATIDRQNFIETFLAPCLSMLGVLVTLGSYPSTLQYQDHPLRLEPRELKSKAGLLD